MRSRRKSLFSCVASVLGFLWGSALAVQAQYGPGVELAFLQDTRVTESSGLATSLRYPDPLTGVLWTHNDSGNPPYLFATNRQGEALACFSLVKATNVDWEDMAEGPGYEGTPSLYLADIGDNGRVRNNLAIYRLPEPDAYQSAAYPLVTPLKLVERFALQYPGGAHYDAEAFLIHPVTGAAYIVTKEASGDSRVFRFPKPLTQMVSDSMVTLVEVAAVHITHTYNFGRMITGGDISPDGTKVVLRTYTDAYEWPISAGQTVEQALSNNAWKRFAIPFAQGESIAYRTDGKALLCTYEASPCPLYELPPQAGRGKQAGREK